MPNGVYAVTVGPDISDDPIRLLFLEEADADRYVAEVEPTGRVTYEPIVTDWADYLKEWAE
jgi:hypothetical protein